MSEVDEPWEMHLSENLSFFLFWFATPAVQLDEHVRRQTTRNVNEIRLEVEVDFALELIRFRSLSEQWHTIEFFIGHVSDDLALCGIVNVHLKIVLAVMHEAIGMGAQYLRNIHLRRHNLHVLDCAIMVEAYQMLNFADVPSWMSIIRFADDRPLLNHVGWMGALH